MTYCLGLQLDEGLVLLSDTRTNAGVDNVSVFRKMTVWQQPGERVIMLMTAGNLAVSQAVVNLLDEGLAGPDSDTPETLLTVPSMFRAARLVGQAIRDVFEADGESLKAQDTSFNASMLLAGKGRGMRLFQLYSAGNFIEATEDTPFFQIGEHKYGKPILDRGVNHATTHLTDGIKLALISMDSTLRSNLSVGMPLDLAVYRRDSLKLEMNRRIDEDDPYFSMIRQRWSQALREASLGLPDPDW